MQSSLWKLGALLGVIGVGFLVLLQVQKSVTSEEGSAEQFSESDAIDELGDIAKPTISESVERASFADLGRPTPARTDEVAEVEPTPAVTVEPTPADPVEVQTVSAGQSVNPFAAVAFAPVSEPEADAESSEPKDEQSNPFANLVRSLTDQAVERVQEAEETTVAAVESFNPFATDSGPTSDTATLDDPSEQAEPGLPIEPVASDDGSLDGVFPQSEVTASAEPLKQYEPTSLTAIPADEPGPSLMSPPIEASQPTMPPQQAEPAVYEVAADEEADPSNEIVQIGVEQRAPWATDPGPGLVFPGSSPPQREETPRSARTANPGLPSIEPQGSVGNVWVGDDAPATTPDDRVVHPDGTVEMTIKPRGGGASNRQPSPREPSVAQPSQGGFNPFATAPERPARQQQSVRQPEPAPFDISPARNTTSSQPRFPDPGLSFQKGPIQPSGAEFSTSGGTNTNPLTSADFVGVGTISPDTPSTPQQAQLTIEKKAPNDAVLGQDLVYSILVRNIGRSPAKNVVIEDLVPKGSELKGTDPQAQMTPDKRLVWKLGTLDPGAQRTIRIKVVPTEAGQIGSVATVSFEAAVASRTIITAPELRLTMNGPSEVRIGEKAPYKFTLTNTGSADASNVFIRTIIPTGFEHPAARQENGVTDIEYEVGVLPRGQSKQIELTLLAVAPGQFQNRTILTADGNVNVETQQPVNVITSRLKIHREGPANRFVGSQARFTNTVSNESSQPLRNVTVTESVPMGVKFVQASDGGHYNAQQRTITWRIDMLEPGGIRRLQTMVLAEKPGQLASTIKAADQRGDSAEAASRLVVAGFSSLTVDVANPGRPIPVGEEVALRLKVRNGGTAAANAVETRIQLPRHLKFVSARGPVRYAQQGEWIAFEPINRIEVQGEQTFDIVLVAVEASNDARVVVQLSSNELSKPLSEDESIVIYADGP